METHSNQVRVAAVFATMNRSKTAEACVMALARQTRPPEWVVVADNASQDDTVSVMKGLAHLPFKLVLHEPGMNLGNAGGVQEAMELAFSLGADAVWILDDDSWPRETAMEALLDGAWDPNVVRHAIQIDPKTGRFSWPLQVADSRGGWKLVSSLEELPQTLSIPSRITWTGALVPRKVREVAGPVMGELFIRGEDEEYPWRFEQAGFTQRAFLKSVLDHPGPANVVHWRILGKNFFFERGLSDWKLYYKIRNMVWLKRRQSGNIKAIMMAVTYSTAAILLDGPARTAILHRAILDGWSGKLGKMSP
jgi:rhamnopyranosyl-N-acetylglucosaminyl-diphospho-decaprenol beta-1,3/1,4-galactofuranosyltransferase